MGSFKQYVISCLILEIGIFFFPCGHFPAQGVVQIICVFSCIKGNKDLIFLLFGKHPANQMISDDICSFLTYIKGKKDLI